MSEITTTIAKLRANFEAWHKQYYKTLHADTYTDIENMFNDFQSANENNNITVNNQIIQIGRFLSKSIDGTEGDINSISDIANTLTGKNNNWLTGNLKALDEQTHINTSQIETLQNISEHFCTESDVKSLINLNGMKTIEIPDSANVDNYKTFGFYKSTTTTNPISEPYVLIVIDANKTNESGNIKQIILTINSNRIFMRSCKLGDWDNNWQELYTTNNTSTIDMEVEFETDGNQKYTQKYTLLKK